MYKQSLWAVMAAAAFSITAAFVKLASAEIGVFELIFWRSVFAVIVLWLFAARTGMTVRTQYLGAHLVRSLLGVLSVGLWFWTLGRMPFGTCMTLTYTTPLFMGANFIALALLRGRPAPWAVVAAIVFGFAGVALVMQPSFDESYAVPAAVCILVAIIDLGVYWQMKVLGRIGEPSWRIVFYFSVAGIVLGAGGAFLEGGFHCPSLQAAAGIAGMGAFATIGQLCTTRSFSSGNLLLSSCLGFTAVPFSALIGLVCYAETPTLTALAGMLLVIVSGISATVSTKRMEREGLAG